MPLLGFVLSALLGLSLGFQGIPWTLSGECRTKCGQSPSESGIVVSPPRGGFTSARGLILRRSALLSRLLDARMPGEFDRRPPLQGGGRGKAFPPRRGAGPGGGTAGGRPQRGRGPKPSGFITDSGVPLAFFRTEKIDPQDTPDLAASQLSAVSKQTLLKKGFVNLTAVQAKVYDAVKGGGDIVVRSRTGTGKTLAFGIPLVEKCAEERAGSGPQVRVVIMEPTRELAIQVTEELKPLCNDHGLSIMTVYGGASIVPQRVTLLRGVDIVVATPGRLLDHIVQGNIQMGTVNHVVLDEGDVMLEMGFQKAVQAILENVRSPGEAARRGAGSALRDDSSSSSRMGEPPQYMPSAQHMEQDQDEANSRHTQVLLFSATMPPWICKITEDHMAAPVFFDAVQEGETKLAQTIEHLYMILPKSRNRIETYASYADDIVALKGTGKQTIVFTNTREEANTIVASESFQQLRVGVLHGDVSQSGRQQVIKTFKDGKLDVLVATDVAARGLDISGVDLVVQLGAPSDANTYVHRSGRTGRSGRNGTSVVLCADTDAYKLQLLERQLNMKFTKMRPPSAKDIQRNIVKIATTKFLKDASHHSALLKDFLDESEGILEHFEEIIVDHSRGNASELIMTDAGGAKTYSPLFVRHVLARCLAGLAGSKQPKPRSLFTGMKDRCTLAAPASLVPLNPAGLLTSDYLAGAISRAVYDLFGVSVYVDVAAMGRSITRTATPTSATTSDTTSATASTTTGAIAGNSAEEEAHGGLTVFFDVSSEHAKELLAVSQAQTEAEGEAATPSDGSVLRIEVCKHLPAGLESQVNLQASAPPRERKYGGYGGPAQTPRRHTNSFNRGRGPYTGGGGGGRARPSGYRPRGDGMGAAAPYRGGGGGGGRYVASN